MELPVCIQSALPIDTARLALRQSGLTLAAEDGEGTQAGFQFFHELVLFATSNLQSPVLKASEDPSMEERGTEPREVCKQRDRGR